MKHVTVIFLRYTISGLKDCVTNYEEVRDFVEQRYPKFLEAERQYMDFILFSRQRTGSTYLKNALNAHPYIGCDVELILYRRDQTIEGSNMPVEQFLNNHANLLAVSGFKLMANQVYDEGCEGHLVIEYMRKYKPKIIKLKRRNLLQIHVSNERAIQLNVAASDMLDNDETKLADLRKKKITINMDTLLDDLKLISDDFDYIDNLVDELRLEYIELFYKDIVGKFRRKKALCNFLGVPVIPSMRSEIDKKTSPKSLIDSIENYNEVYEMLYPAHPEFFEKEL